MSLSSRQSFDIRRCDEQADGTQPAGMLEERRLRIHREARLEVVGAVEVNRLG